MTGTDPDVRKEGPEGVPENFDRPFLSEGPSTSTVLTFT